MEIKVSRLKCGLLGFTASLALVSGLAAEDKPTAADNSKKNEVHDGTRAVTADQQNNSKNDVEITRKIRRSLTSDKSLSTYAHNVKIITQNGAVVLKGPVRSAQEKSAVEAKTAEVVGQAQMKSEIEVSAQ